MSACRHNSNIDAVKCKRGRPPGVKNKLKHPAATSTPFAALETHILQIPAADDVAESFAAFARSHHAFGVCVLSASGRIATAVLKKASPYPSTLTFQGSFDLLSMTATFLPGRGVRSLAVTLAGPSGQVVGGVVAGELVAAGIVVVVAATFASPKFHRMNKIDNTLKSTLPVAGNKEEGMLHKCLVEVERDLDMQVEPLIGGYNGENEVAQNRLQCILKDFEQCIEVPAAVGSASKGADIGTEKMMDMDVGVGESEILFDKCSDDSTIIDCVFESDHHDYDDYSAFHALGSFDVFPPLY